MLPSSTDLDYFIEVFKTQNLARAAERLGVTQPSLSLSLKRLESNMGIDLFIRSKKGVQPNSAAKLLFNRVEELKRNWQELKNEALQSQTEVNGRIRIGCHPSVGLYTLPFIMEEIVAKHPALEVQFFHDLSRKVTERVISMDVDLGIVINPVSHPDLVIKKLDKDLVTLFFNPKLKQNRDVLIFDPDLIQAQTIVKKAAGQFKRQLHSSNLEIIRSLTESGAGVGVLPTRVAEQSRFELQKLSGAPSFNDEIALVYRMEKKNHRALQVVSSAVERFFSK
jgi:LysR family transcriptional regulator, cell division regulator